MDKKYCELLTFIFVLSSFIASGLSVGSNSAVSRQSYTMFPAMDNDNTMLGFASFEGGFMLQDYTTSCTFNNYFPLSGQFNLSGGTLFLQKDMVLTDNLCFFNAGKIYGNGYSLEFPKSTTDLAILYDTSPVVVQQVASNTSSPGPYGTDWNATNQYIAVALASSSAAELAIMYFTGSTLTTLTTLAMPQLVPTNVTLGINSVRWHPTLNYLAIGTNTIDYYAIGTDTVGSELQIYNFNTSNTSLVLTGAQSYPGPHVIATVAWHPSGNYLVVANTGMSNQYLVSYSFNTATGVATQLSTASALPLFATVAPCLSFASGGNNLLALGGGVDTYLQIFSFSSGILTSQAELNLGANLSCLDWSPTGTYIAIGTQATSGNNFLIYAYNKTTATLTQVVGLALPVSNQVVWDPTGTLIAITLSSDPSTGVSPIKLYFFDKTFLTLTEIAGASMSPGSSQNYGVRFSRDGKYLVTTDAQTTTHVYNVHSSVPLDFINTDVVFNTGVNVTIPVQFQGNCKLDARGNKITLASTGSITVRPVSNLIIDNAQLVGVEGNNLQCMTDSGSFILRNSSVEFSRNYTFSSGSILFDQEVLFTGTNTFAYTSGLTSTINSLTTLMIDHDMTLSYAPRVAYGGLIYMTDQTSNLYLRGCTLYSTRTGLQLQRGTLLLDDSVTLSSAAINSGEALALNSSLTTKVRGNASVSLFGFVKIS